MSQKESLDGSYLYEKFKNSEEQLLDIVEGNLVLSNNGFIKISKNLVNYSLNLDHFSKVATLIVPKSDYRGKYYRLKRQDCVSLVCNFLDNNYSTNYTTYYKKLSNAKFLELYLNDLSLWFNNSKFIKVEEPQVNDIIFYKADGNKNHIGIYLSNNKILHHLPSRLSCIDNVDYSLIGGIYRYVPN